MRIVIFSGIQKPTDKISKTDIFGTAQLYSYYLRKEMEKLGIETVPCRCPSINAPIEAYGNDLVIPRGDHIISVEQRGFYLRKQYPDLMNKVKQSISGKICTICDNNAVIGPEDLLFYAVPAPVKEKSVYVGWAADKEECYPDKDPNTLRILIDHSYYGKYDNSDWSRRILPDVLNFKNAFKNKNVIVRRFISGGVETCNANSKDEIYNRSGLNYVDACKEYRKADIFIVTHQESMGLSVLESAMSGALVLSPPGFIKPELLNPLSHLIFNGRIPWDKAIFMINHNEAHKKTLLYNWNNVTTRILKELKK